MIASICGYIRSSVAERGLQSGSRLGSSPPEEGVMLIVDVASVEGSEGVESRAVEGGRGDLSLELLCMDSVSSDRHTSHSISSGPRAYDDRNGERSKSRLWLGCRVRV